MYNHNAQEVMQMVSSIARLPEVLSSLKAWSFRQRVCSTSIVRSSVIPACVFVYLAESHGPAGEKGTTNCLHRLKSCRPIRLAFLTELDVPYLRSVRDWHVMSSEVKLALELFMTDKNETLAVCLTVQLQGLQMVIKGHR